MNLSSSMIIPKKYLIIVILVAVLIAPNFVLASWYNPFSWGIWNSIFHFQKSEQKQEQIKQENKIEKKVEDTVSWKTYTNTEYGFEFKYPSGVFDNIFGSAEKECSNRYPNIQKYPERSIFEFDQSGVQGMSMSGVIICESLEKSKIDSFVADINSTHSSILEKNLNGQAYYQTDLYGATGQGGGSAVFMKIGNNTLMLTFYKIDLSIIDKMLSTFKFTK